MLAQVLWPRQVLEEKRTDLSSIASTIGSSDSTAKATLTSQGNGIVCTGNMPLGVQFIVLYRIVTSQENSRKENTGKTEPVGAESASSILSPTTSPTEPRLHLEEKRCVLAPKPLSKVLNMSEGPIVETQNLVMVLEELAQNGMDIASALGSLKASTTNGTGEVENVRKNK